MKIMPMSVNQNNSRNYSMRKADPNFTSSAIILSGFERSHIRTSVGDGLKNYCRGGDSHAPIFYITRGQENTVAEILGQFHQDLGIGFAIIKEEGEAAKQFLRRLG